jgi:hypothetical protein
MKTRALSILLLTAIIPLGKAQSCHEIHGRAVQYRGDAFFEIWHVGTHHIFFPADSASADLICRYFDCENGNRQPALFADFTICPTEPYKQGAAQPAIVKSVQHPRVIPEWPPLSAQGFVEEFYKWYAPRVLPENTDKDWHRTLDFIRWDLSDQLAALLEKDTAAHVICKKPIALDFDPFLHARESADRYEFGHVQKLGSNYRADIFRVENGKRADKPDVTAEFRRQDEHWVFTNFYYPSGSDLIAVLKSSKPCSTQ